MTMFNEGSISLIGTDSGSTYSSTVPFNLLSQTLPTGLLDSNGLPTNYFSSNGSSLVDYISGSSYTWQGATFTGLTAGTYQFTYIPIASPTANWQPVDTPILSSIISLTTAFISSIGGNPATPDIINTHNGQNGYNALSALTTGTSSNFSNRFAGGTLVVDSVGTLQSPVTNSSNFTIAAGANQAIIDQNSNYAVLAGTFSDDTTNGRLVIQNNGSTTAGAIALTNITNSYTGGTEVQAGATLSIADSRVLGTGGLDLVGSSTVPAVLSTTADMTISNSITVTGDPVFNIASGTTTTISTPITDGSSAGDVVVSGGGTFALTAANTYTGLTAVDAGSTLALVGNGSITPSSALNNSGTVDVTAKTGNVALGGTFTQTSTGSLLMNISATNNQKVNVAGAASLAGALSLNASAGTYTAGKYTLLTANGVTGTFGSFSSNLSSFTRLGYTLSYDANDVYLNFLPNLMDTQNSLQANVAALQGVYALQTGTVNNSLSYDCNNFGANGFCVSTGGRYSNASESTANTTSAMIIAGYRINDHLRIGASADQNLYNTDVAQIASVRSNTPLMGAFVVWNQKADKTGFETKVAAGYNNSDLNVNRSVVGTSEAGQGSTALNTLSESLTTSYAFKLGENYLVSPYAGVRHTSVSANGYSEQSTANVTAPLSYNGLNQESTSALLGVRLAGQVYKNTTVQTSAGFEEDMHNSVNNYSATGLAGLSAITFNPNIQRTRAVVNFGASYELAKGHHLGFNTIYRQESFQGVDTKMAYVNYSMGF